MAGMKTQAPACSAPRPLALSVLPGSPQLSGACVLRPCAGRIEGAAEPWVKPGVAAPVPPILLAWLLYLLSLLSVKSQSGPRWWDNSIFNCARTRLTSYLTV